MAAGLTKIGLELQINHGTPGAPAHGVGGSQTAPDVAALTNGDFIVAFQSISELGDQDIYAQQITAAGAYDDVQRDVAAFTPDQTNPTVAPTAGGGYVTAWDGFSDSIQLNVFSPATGTFSTPFTIRDTSANPASYSDPTIATFANGNYVLTYQSLLGSANNLEVAVVNPGGTALVKGIEIADNTSPSPAVATAGNGALIAYLATDTGPLTPGFNEIKIDEIDSAGNTSFSSLLTESPNPIGSLQVAGLADGRFALVWTDGAFGNQNVRGAIFDPVTHSETSIDFTISLNGYGPTLTDPHVAATPDGGFVVAWDETGFPRDSGTDVFAQRFNRNGKPVGSDIEVNSITAGYQGISSLAVSSAGQVLVSWADFSASNPNSTDVNPGRIQGQLFNLTPLSPPKNDFNGDGSSDLLWRNAGTGQVGIWNSNGSGGFTYQIINQGDPTWQLQDTGDLNGDGKADLLWRNTGSGQLGLWDSNGAGGFTYQIVSQGDLNWQIQGVGDFNGDGNSDLLWSNTSTGQLGLWYSNGSGGFTYQTVNQGDLTWQIQSTGDFNGDGKSDILWRNTVSGQVGIWDSNGSGGFTYQTINQGDLNWQIQGVGDFNGDGKADILWRNTSTGQVGIWDSNGSGGFTYQVINQGDLTWQIQGVGDFNGDGNSDILWRNTVSGQVGIWDSNGSGGFTYQTINQGDLSWNTFNGNDTLVASTANSTLFGNPGNTTFAIGPGAGQDKIYNFTTSQDTLQFNHALFANFAAAMTNATQVGANTVFAIDANDSVTLENVNKNSLAASNFRFA
jgi:hypothetical protein